MTCSWAIKRDWTVTDTIGIAMNRIIASAEGQMKLTKVRCGILPIQWLGVGKQNNQAGSGNCARPENFKAYRKPFSFAAAT